MTLRSTSSPSGQFLVMLFALLVLAASSVAHTAGDALAGSLDVVDRMVAGNTLKTDYTPDGQCFRSCYDDVHNGREWTRFYLPDMDVQFRNGTFRFFRYIDDGIIYVSNGSADGQTYYTFTDHLGSIRNIVAADGTEVFSATYDAWGRQSVARNDLGFFRGYTGHEMLSEFGLVNMNGRMYDPLLARFISCDNYVQQPDNTQSFNRYSYCLNNPLKYIDPDGEFWWVVAAGLIGGAVNLGLKAYNGQVHGWEDGLMAFGIGFTAGAVEAVTGGAALSVAGGAGIGGFFGGAISGAVGATYSTATLGIANNTYFGDPLPSNREFLTTVFTSALTAGLINGAASSMSGKTFWTGGEKVVPAMQIEPITPASIYDDDPIFEIRVIGLNNEHIVPQTVVQESMRSPLFPRGDGSYTVYSGVDQSGSIRYVGITKRTPEVRFTEHLSSNSPKAYLYYAPIESAYGLTMPQARIIEQNLINYYKLEKFNGQLFNKINSIAPRYWGEYGIIINF